MYRIQIFKKALKRREYLDIYLAFSDVGIRNSNLVTPNLFPKQKLIVQAWKGHVLSFACRVMETNLPTGKVEKV